MKSQSLTRYSALACLLAVVGCSSSDDNTNTDASVEAGGSGGTGGSSGSANEASAPEAGAADVRSDVSIEAAAEAAVDAGVDARLDATADTSNEARPDVAAEASREGSTEGGEAAAPDAGSTVGDDAAVPDEASSVGPDAAASEGDGGYVRPGCTPPSFEGPAVTPASATILDMESTTSAFTQAVPSDPGNWVEPDVDPILPDAGVRSPHEFVAITPPRGASTRAIHSYASGYQYGGSVVLAFMNTFLKPLDASAYRGITFYAKGSAATTSLRVEISLTGALEQYCRCNPGGNGEPSRCNDNPSSTVNLTTDWQAFTIPWAQFHQDGYGNPIPTDPTQLLNVVFRPEPPNGAPSGIWDFWLDDVAFAAAP